MKLKLAMTGSRPSRELARAALEPRKLWLLRRLDCSFDQMKSVYCTSMAWSQVLLLKEPLVVAYFSLHPHL